MCKTDALPNWANLFFFVNVNKAKTNNLQKIYSKYNLNLTFKPIDFTVNIKDRGLLYNYCSLNQCKNLSKEIDSTTIGIELCKIPQISEHWP